jgi:hypothetical protein
MARGRASSMSPTEASSSLVSSPYARPRHGHTASTDGAVPSGPDGGSSLGTMSLGQPSLGSAVSGGTAAALAERESSAGGAGPAPPTSLSKR